MNYELLSKLQENPDGYWILYDLCLINGWALPEHPEYTFTLGLCDNYLFRQSTVAGDCLSLYGNRPHSYMGYLIRSKCNLFRCTIWGLEY
jgi:hypothetical protein